MKFFELSIANFVLRFYALMAVVIIAGFTGIWPLALLALPIFLSGMLGLSKTKAPKQQLNEQEVLPTTTAFAKTPPTSKKAFIAEQGLAA